MDSALQDFLNSQVLCTVASVNEAGTPQAALVGYSNTNDLKLYFGTSKLTRKYKNIKTNPNVAIVIADLSAEVQYEGKAEEITDELRKKEIIQRHQQKVPGAQKFLNDQNQVYFEILPTWLRFIQHGNPDKVTEMVDF